MLRASEHGLKISKPFGESQAYDFIVDQDSRLLRIQVKCNSQKADKYGGFHFKILRGNRSKYEFDEVDFFALYIVNLRIFYLIPSHATCDKTSVKLYPDTPESKFLIYKERWEF